MKVIANIAARTVFTIMIVTAIVGCDDSHDPGRTAEKTAVASPSHPYAGFWKQPGCSNDFGLAIAPAKLQTYTVSFCGPGGCFKPGTYRPNTPLVGDSDYRILDKNTIEVLGTDGFTTYVRCEKR